MTVKKVTQEQIDNIIAHSKLKGFHRVHDKQCIIVAELPNGFTVVGESACVDPANYDEQIGFDLAVEHIKKRLWEFEGYVLQNKLHLEELAVDFVEQVEIANFQNKNGWELKDNQVYKKLVKALLSGQEATQAQMLNEATALSIESPTIKQGHIRFTSTAYIGEQSKDISVEGAVADVLKVLGTLD